MPALLYMESNRNLPEWNLQSRQRWPVRSHYGDVIMGTIASQITSLTIVYSTVYSGRSKKTSKLRVTGLCVGNSPGTGEFPAKWPVTRKMFPFDDAIMRLFRERSSPALLESIFTYLSSFAQQTRVSCCNTPLV